MVATAGLLTVSLTVAVPPGVSPSFSAHYGWRRGSESNRRIRLLQSPALPLGYPAIQPTERLNQILSRASSNFSVQLFSNFFPTFLRPADGRAALGWRAGPRAGQTDNPPAPRSSHQLFAPSPEVAGLEDAHGRNDAGNQFGGGDVEPGIERATRRVGHTHVGADRSGTTAFGG